MKKQELKQKARADWIKVYGQLRSTSKAARRCGIARSTLQRWIRRLPEEELANRSGSPHQLGGQKWDDEVANLILDIWDTRAPMDVLPDMSAPTPLWEDIEAIYDPAKEPSVSILTAGRES